MNSNNRITATLYSVGTLLQEYKYINTLHKVDDDDDDNNNNNNTLSKNTASEKTTVSRIIQSIKMQ